MDHEPFKYDLMLTNVVPKNPKQFPFQIVRKIPKSVERTVGKYQYGIFQFFFRLKDNKITIKDGQDPGKWRFMQVHGLCLESVYGSDLPQFTKQFKFVQFVLPPGRSERQSSSWQGGAKKRQVNTEGI